MWFSMSMTRRHRCAWGVARVYNPSVGINDELVVVVDGAVRDDLYEIGISDAREFVPGAKLGDTIRVTDRPDGTGIHYLDARKFNLDLGSVTIPARRRGWCANFKLQNPHVASRGSVPITRGNTRGHQKRRLRSSRWRGIRFSVHYQDLRTRSSKAQLRSARSD